MPLTPGLRLGRYEVISPIGAGGMGEVYRARDTTLNRDVAIKVIPAELAGDRERLRRFEQEALATAALNHPNIVAVFDVGTEAGTSFVVSELLEGRTLREVLAAGALPQRKAVEYASQVAAGLGAAHEKGIVHRDIKPDNLFVTGDGRVKIFDFGIARILRDPLQSPGGAGADAPTVTTPGTVIGTVGYMAPEQIRGEPVDHRADIFSFGAVFYEMLTRQRAFKRDSVPGTLAAILKDDPPPVAGDTVSPRLVRLVLRCLEKQPGARYQSARDLSLVLADDASEISRTSPRTASTWRPGPRLAAAAVIIAALGITAGRWLPLGRSTPAPEPYSFQMALGPGESWGYGMAISNDGRRLVFANEDPETGRQLILRTLGTVESKLLPGTDGARLPFFSPDGTKVGFFADGKLRWVALDGSSPHDICPAPTPFGGAWGLDDHIVFAPAGSGGLLRVAIGDGTPQTLTTPDKARQETSDRFPQVLPDGSAVIFMSLVGQTTAVNAQSLVTGARVRLIDDGHSAQYAMGQLVFARGDGEMFAAPWDPRVLAGPVRAVPLRERVGPTGTLGILGGDVPLAVESSTAAQ